MKGLCPICEQKEFKIIGKPQTNSISEKIIDQEYKVVKCNNCSAYFVNPAISFSNDEWAMLYNTEYFADQSEWLKRKRHKELMARFNKASALSQHKNLINFLDIGCGEGKALIEAYKSGWKVTAIDITDNRIEGARSNEINFVKGHFLEIGLPSNSFDFIYLDSVLEHVLDPIAYLVKVRSLLKEGGIVYIGVPNEDSLFNFIRKIIFIVVGRVNVPVKIKPFDVPYHVIGFNKKSLIFAANKVYLNIKKIRNFGRRFELLGSSPKHKSFWINLFFLFPVEFLGKMIQKDVYSEFYLSK